MIQQIFVNLPVKDLTRSIAFFGALGFTFNPKFTDEKAACMILGENMFAMLLVEPFFQGFTKKPVADAAKATEVIVALSVESRARVQEFVAKAVAAGAATPVAAIDHGFMYQHGFEDLDGHQWELFHMDSDAQG
ncbi:MAG: VOC family protein [Dokdonella sp.]